MDYSPFLFVVPLIDILINRPLHSSSPQPIRCMTQLLTTLWCDNWVIKHIPWSAFKMVESDWTRVIDIYDICT